MGSLLNLSNDVWNGFILNYLDLDVWNTLLEISTKLKIYETTKIKKILALKQKTYKYFDCETSLIAV